MERATSIESADAAAIPLRYRRWKNHPAPGTDFPDITPAATDGATVRQVVEALARQLPGDTEIIGGIDVGGLGLAGALAYRNALGMLDIRKVGSIRVEVIRTIMANYELGDGVAISRAHGIAGRRLTIVDDCLMTGGHALAAIRLIRRLGGHCDTAMFVFELDGMGGRSLLAGAGIRVHSLRLLPQAEPEAPEGGLPGPPAASA
jgi:adenine phosphoribosyltransferase